MKMQINKSDPVIDEVREVRHRISAQFGHDSDRLVDYYIRLLERYGDRLISTTPATIAGQAQVLTPRRKAAKDE